MKILDRYILTSFVKTFLSVFTILMFIFILQSVWRFIEEFAGKDIDLDIISKFLFFLLPNLIPMVLPLTILLASIMTFGSFAEQYEFAAMKSAGISLQRAMRSLIVFILLLAVVTFYFANTVIPHAEGKVLNMRKNIAQVKPSMAIVEGAFNDLGNINIKVKEKSGPNGKNLDDVIIHKKSENRVGNYTVIKADRGVLESGLNSNVLSLVLYDGNYYNEIPTKTYQQNLKAPFVKSAFDRYVLNIDLSDFNNVDLEDESLKHPYKMLNTSELKIQLDSFSNDYKRSIQNYDRLIKQRSGVLRAINSDEVDEEKNNTRKINQKSDERSEKDSLNVENKNENTYDLYSNLSLDSLFWEYNFRQRTQLFNVATNSINSIIPQISSKKNQIKQRQMLLNKIEMSMHNKYALPFACIILFFVGAPLGAIIRKGGLGLPMVVAIVVFLTYHFIGLFAGNSAEGGSIPAFVGSWLSTIILLPLSVYLTYRATTDQGFVNLDFITVPIDKIIKKIKTNFLNIRNKKND
ncbi:LptF/LptG family permease [Psychroflexus sediminis]|uniref:Lipopolysaccharide export system permease protein n=1 Tax=Psychroflexus sediminis TaxID=470826 RepID=A0A1G7Z0H5_9FLAO|nr:LptF/LptG family permease [Psychroflexus sediminis]SDH02268.1 lipopolysaccharide export system permease protein [Psychroflexus sediminis]